MPLPRYRVKDWTYVRGPGGLHLVTKGSDACFEQEWYEAEILTTGNGRIPLQFTAKTSYGMIRHIESTEQRANPKEYQRMTTKPETEKPFHETALLVSLNIKTFGAHKHDKKASKETADNNDAEEDSVKANKSLVSKTMLEPITKAMSALRTFHYDNSLPWLDEGVRVLPSANYEPYKAEMEKHKDAFDAAVRRFCEQWPEVILDAQKRLGKMFKPDDYPVDIADRFGVKVRFMPLPEAGDWRLPALADVEQAALAAQRDATMDDAKKTAMRDVWERLATDVKSMAVRLAAYKADDGTTKPFRDSLVENMRETVALIPRLNFADDPELERIRLLVNAELCGSDAQELREDDAKRAATVERAEKIAAEIGEFMGTPGA